MSIIADVEQCPETPPPLEPTNNDKNNNINKHRKGSSPTFGQEFVYGTAVPTNVWNWEKYIILSIYGVN